MEVVRIDAPFVHLAVHQVVLPAKKAKGKKPRVIYLTGLAESILRPLLEKHPTGATFRNSKGKLFNKNPINCAFCRLEKKLGYRIHLGAFRKCYCTEALKNGVNLIALANLMGHSNSAMIAKHYEKLAQDPVFMAEVARRAKGG
jgi:integrase/recombinase XerD